MKVYKVEFSYYKSNEVSSEYGKSTAYVSGEISEVLGKIEKLQQEEYQDYDQFSIISIESTVNTRIII